MRDRTGTKPAWLFRGLGDTGVESYRERLERIVLNPLRQTDRVWWAVVLFLGAIVAWGFYAFIVQLRYGLITTGMDDHIMWGLYMVNFVFFIGISHAGTLISAILRVTGASWRTPITRMAELITVVALMVGALMPVIDMGRPDRVLNMVFYGRFQSPLVWDIIAITSYLFGSLIYFYLPSIPDFALIRDRLGKGTSAIKRKIYTLLSVGWRGTPEQKKRLEKAVGIMAITIIPIAISVHTVVSFIFSMTLRPGWDSTIFGIYFVIGAIFSGIASIIILMAIFRKLYHLEEYLTERHFRLLGHMLLASLLLYAYLTFQEYLTVAYKMELEEKHLFELLLQGKNALWFWFFAAAGMVIPAILLIFRRGPVIPKLLVASVLINIGMWIKRFVIIIPTLEVPMMPFEFGGYTPSWVEVSITVGAFASFILILVLFAKVVPLISIWEVAEEAEMEESPPVGEEEK